MQAIATVISTVFWGLLLLSVLVFVHEGGHYLAARACGVRVTEYFLGLPCRWRASFVSKRNGTRFGITPLLLGGYAMICGMDPTKSEHAARVLGFVHRNGRANVEDIARELVISEDEALEACIQLMDWGSVAAVYDPEKGEFEGSSTYPSTYASVPRDEAGNTVLDGRQFDRTHATAEGEVWNPPCTDEEFLERERSHTYLGKGFWRRASMLIAGIFVNLLFGFLLLMCIYSVVGIEVAQNTNVIGGIEAGSIAEEIGIEPGDAVRSIGGMETETWEDIIAAISAAKGADEPFEVVFEHDGTVQRATVELAPDEILGVTVSYGIVRLSPVDSARQAWWYISETARGIARLFNPQHTLEMLDSSTSVVGISVMSAQAAAEGPTTFLALAALISFSLGLMNLLPIPPLDGGKLVIEVIQAVTRRELPLKVQTIVSYVGVALFLALFVYVLRNDILRFII